MTTRGLGRALAALLLLATLGEGGASPNGLLATHGAIVALLIGSLLLPRKGGDEDGAAPSALAWALASFSALALAGAAFAPYRFAAVLVLQEIAAFAIVFFLGARVGMELPGALSLPVLSGGAVLGAFAIVERLSGVERPAATFLNANHLAAWLVAALLLGLGARRGDSGRAERAARVALAVPIVAALAVTGSRGALVGLAAGGTWLLARSWPRWDRRARIAIVGVAAAVVLAVAVGVSVRFERGDPFRYHRLRIWRASLESIASSPWLGTGAGQFQTAAANLNFPIEEGPLRYAREFRSTHSDLLRLPVEFGIPAAAIALAGLALAGARARSALRTGAAPARVAGAVAALVALAAQAVVENLGERPAIHLLAAALLGALASSRRAPEPRASLPLRAAAAVLVSLAFVAGDVATYSAWRESHRLPRGPLLPDQERSLRLALSRNPFHPDLWLRRAEALSGDRRSWDVSRYAEAREAAERAVRLQPADSRYRRGLARVEATACLTLFRDEATRDRAARNYEAAAELARHDPFLPLELGRFLIEAGDPSAARRAAERALRIEPEAIPAKLLLAEALLAQGGPGSVEAAEEWLRDAEESARRSAGRAREPGYEARLLTPEESRVRAIRERMRGEPSSR